MWASYKKYATEGGFKYDDQVVLDSIEESHRIAFDRIEKFFPDNTVRLPSFVVPAGFTATQALVQYSLEGLKARRLPR